MDISEIYVNMCGHATEIQKQKESISIDSYENKLFWMQRDPRTFCILCGTYILTKYCPQHGERVEWREQEPGVTHLRAWEIEKYPDTIWLPRQDELQLILDEPKFLSSHLANFKEFIDQVINSDYYYGPLLSMEQIWLCFIMKEKYNKVWNGEKWKKVKK